MKERTIDRDKAVAGWIAARDANMRSIVASQCYTNKQKIRCCAIQSALASCYNTEEVYLTYRKKFAAIKVVPVRKEDINVADVADIEASWATNTEFSVDKVLTPQGIIYRVKFN